MSEVWWPPNKYKQILDREGDRFPIKDETLYLCSHICVGVHGYNGAKYNNSVLGDSGKQGLPAPTGAGVWKPELSVPRVALDIERQPSPSD